MEEKKILVVDDEEPIRNLMTDLLTAEGYTVLTAANGKEALDWLRKEGVMCMFVDLGLPGKNGIKLGDEIRKQNQVAIMYAFTGDASFFNLTDCRVAGYDDFFMKPVKVEALLKAAADAFEKIERWKAFEFDLV